MFSVRGIKFKYFAMIMAVICIIAGVYLTFFSNAGYAKTTGTILSIVEEPGVTSDDDSDYVVTVGYDVDGTHYESTLDTYSPNYKEGKTVDVLYDPKDPSVAHGQSRGMGIYALVVGVGILVISALSGIRTRSALEKIEKQRGAAGAKGASSASSSAAGAGQTAGAEGSAAGTGTAQASGAKGSAAGGKSSSSAAAPLAVSDEGEERKLYFLTDTGTPKYGHRIEDRNRRVLYEAKMTKFSLLGPHSFDFIDHEHGTTTPHLVGHEEETDWGNSLLLDNHYTFDFDGKDIWKYLKENGIGVRTERVEGTIMPRYRVSRGDREIAVIECSSYYVHEEDADQHSVASKMPVPGFYRIRTRQENLETVFVTAVAFARSGALNDEGGTYGKILRDKIQDSFGKE